MNWPYILGYLIIQFLLGVYLTRFVKSEGDFFLAGRRIPTFAIVFSIFATWFGAETCIGSSAAVFAQGLAGSKAEPLGYGLCLFLLGILIAPKLWNEKYTTLGDFFKDRYSTSTEKIAVWILAPSSLIWAAAQIKAFGHVISSTTPLEVDVAISVATIFVILYTLMGGLLGDIVTDVIQGGILAITLLILFFFAIYSGGGVSETLLKISPEKLTFISSEESLWSRLDSWLIPIFGSLIAQELIARVLSCNGKKQAVKSSYGGMGLYLFFGSIPVVLGLIGDKFPLSFTESEEFLPTLAQTILPSWLYILFIGALISAILSTIDSILLAISALISHNFILPTFNITDPKKKLLSARIVLVVSGIIAYFIAVRGQSVYHMVEAASSFGSTGIVVITIGGLYTKTLNAKYANFCLILGLVFSVLFDYILNLNVTFSLSLILIASFYTVATFYFKFIKNPESIDPEELATS
ncbi:MAG: sodium:solute symporter family protein [Halobacteriovoraceae bacterium]|nr:sodium:solute symporter family protein [Halobacteriovoraceae bacterium]MCB9095280.1 sodium:solute symporter family protein [Halobacteriovoraceae bacterium]